MRQTSKRRRARDHETEAISTAQKTGKQSEPPSLDDLCSEFERAVQEAPLFAPNWPPSEFDKLCEKFGGPADLGIPVDHSLMNEFRRCCAEIRPHQLIPILRRFAKGQDEAAASRHYPWAAFAIRQYRFATKELREREPSPKEILKLFSRIGSAAEDLISALGTLHSIACRMPDPTAPMRRGHLAWLNAFFAQAIAGHPSNDLDNYDLGDDWQKLAFIKQLALLRAVAIKASEHFDKTLVERERGQRNPALRTFVGWGAKIWGSLTARRPNAHKVSKKTTSDPDFVAFLGELARIGQLAVPTPKQVETSLNSITAKFSS